MSTHIVRRDPVLAALLVLGAIGVLFALRWREQGLPIAAINFAVLRTDAVALARQHAGERVPQFNVQQHQAAVGFRTDFLGQAYVERHAGLPELNRLGNDELPIWFWRVRFFRPLQREEVSVQVHPSGRMIGFQHVVPEDLPGAALDDAAARRLAERFLSTELRRDALRLQLVDGRREERPSGRLDHQLTWERTDFHLAEARHRIRVTVQGDAIGGFQEFLRLPETWTVDQRREANRGRTLAGVSRVGYAGLVLAALAVAFRRLRGGGLEWRLGAGFGLVAGALILLATLNSLPLYLLRYPTEAELPAYIGQALLGGAAGALVLGLLILVAAASGTSLEHSLSPGRPGLTSLAGRPGLRSWALVRSVLAGYAIAGIWVGYIVAFYWAGLTFFGVWVPVEVPYDDIMSTFAPMIYPLTIGAYPAIDEEFTFRLLAVPLLALALLRVLPWRWLALGVAVVVPGLVWAALHSTYPQQPFYTRAVELTVVGTVSGLLFLRYGVLATVISHYLFNAGVTGTLFFLSGRPYLMLSGAVPLVLPALALLPAALHKVRGGVILRDAELLASTAPGAPPARDARAGPAAAEAPPAAVTPVLLAPLPVLGRRATLVIGGLALLALAAAVALPAPVPGDALRLRVGRGEAIERSRAALRTLGVAIPLDEGWVEHAAVTTAAAGGSGGFALELAATYVRRLLGTVESNRLLGDAVVPVGWRIRYFRSLQHEEVAVFLAPDGRLAGFHHTREERAAGARLAPEEARLVAQQTWSAMGVPLAEAQLVDASTQVRDARTDHRFVWELGDARARDARFRLAAEVHGDRPGRLQRLLKVPEGFERAIKGTRTHQIVAGGMFGMLVTAFGIWLLIQFGRAIRDGEVHGRFAAAAAGLVVAAGMVQRLTEAPALMQGYVTAVSVTNYVLVQIAGMVVTLALLFVGVFVAAAVAEWLYRQAFPDRPDAPQQMVALLRSVSRGSGSDLAPSAVIALGLLGLAATAGLVYGWLAETALREGLEWRPEWPLALLNSALPVVHAVAASAATSIAALAVIATAVLGLRRWLGRPLWVVVALAVAGLLGSAANAHAAEEFARAALLWCLVVAAGYVALRWLARERVPPYLLAAFAFSMAGAARGLVQQEVLWHQLHGWFALLIGLGPVGVGVALAALRRGESAAYTPSASAQPLASDP